VCLHWPIMPVLDLSIVHPHHNITSTLWRVQERPVTFQRKEIGKMTEEENKVKIAVCIPWDTPFVWTLPMFNMLNWDHPENSEVKFFMGAGWCPASRHNDVVEKALAWDANLVMFNGADHLCDFDILVRMYDRISKEGWDMVHAIVPARGVVGEGGKPFKTISYKVVGPMPKENAVLYMPPGSTETISYDDEPQETHISGTGNIMMKAEIFSGLTKPYFKEFIKKDGRYGRICVQDSDFVYRCTIESGAKMFCDTTIRIKHLDAFGIDETYSERFSDKEDQMDWSPSKDLRGHVCPSM